MLATLMAMGIAEFARSIATDNVAQARELAQGFGYHVLAAEPESCGTMRLTLGVAPRRPRLRLVEPVPS